MHHFGKKGHILHAIVRGKFVKTDGASCLEQYGTVSGPSRTSKTMKHVALETDFGNNLLYGHDHDEMILTIRKFQTEC